jgi:ubiquinone/menaquinone biosynthesis C-methylase UbiE
MKKSRQEKKFWNSFAHRYDQFIDRHAKHTYAFIKELLMKEIKREDTMLEVGTGTGIFAFILAEQVKSITAIDFAEEMIGIAKEKQKEEGINNIIFQAGDVCKLSFPDKSIDAIIAVNVFHLLGNPSLALKESKRVLKTNGKLIIPTYCHGSNLKSLLLSLTMGITGFKARNRWSINGFRLFIQNAGFEVKKEIIIKERIPLSFIVAHKN